MSRAPEGNLRMVDQPWTPDSPEQLPPKVAAEIRQYARRFRHLRKIVSVQVLISGLLCGGSCLWMGIVMTREKSPIAIVGGLGLLGLTLLSLIWIRSSERRYQLFAYNFAQAANGYTLLVSGCGSLAWLGSSAGKGMAFVGAIALGAIAVVLLYGFVWMLLFHHQSLRIARYRQEYKLKPKEGWEVSPWGNFESPIDAEELEVDGSWDSGGKNSSLKPQNDADDWDRPQ